MVQAITTITGRGISLLLDDIDTDRIIPARFLRCVTFDGIGTHAFEDDRQQDPGHPFNDAKYREAKVLIAGRNFGCGSSREHAPQALMRWGIQAIVAESFAEIFFGNCTSLGIPCLCASRADLEKLGAAVVANPQATITVDVANQSVSMGDVRAATTMPAGAKSSLVTGNWDFLGQLLDGAAATKQTASAIAYMNGFRV